MPQRDYPLREFDSLGWFVRVGCPWRLLQDRPPDPSAVILDSRTLQSTPESGARAGFDGHKKRKGSKVHTAVDTLGHLLALHVTPANEQDRAQIGELAQGHSGRGGGKSRTRVSGSRLYRKRTRGGGSARRNPVGGRQTPPSQAGLRAPPAQMGRRTILRLDGALPATCDAAAPSAVRPKLIIGFKERHKTMALVVLRLSPATRPFPHSTAEL